MDLKEGNVVEEFMIGPTKVKICDDCCRDKTPEDVEKILDRIMKRALPVLRVQHEREMEKLRSKKD